VSEIVVRFNFVVVKKKGGNPTSNIGRQKKKSLYFVGEAACSEIIHDLFVVRLCCFVEMFKNGIESSLDTRTNISSSYEIVLDDAREAFAVVGKRRIPAQLMSVRPKT
jgi:hypothetical protein